MRWLVFYEMPANDIALSPLIRGGSFGGKTSCELSMAGQRCMTK
jgi:hypothetical protein